jgi:hypothetical protein
MPLNTTQLVAAAIALLIAWLVGRLGWRLASNVAEPVEDWIDSMFDAAPAVAKLATVMIALALFLCLAGGIAFALWPHVGDLVAFSAKLVSYLGRAKL